MAVAGFDPDVGVLHSCFKETGLWICLDGNLLVQQVMPWPDAPRAWPGER